AFLGLILERYFALAGKDKRLMLVADHGFTELKVEVDLNAFLAQQGFLTWARQARNEWDVQSIAKDS
ncbi:MAG TPA: phosphodiesterase, partial [Desulfonauticus sp.]|nr:phosphodiesterase [Desulfonauticus sp.]